MIAYAIRRVMLMVPTLFAIMVVNFFIVQAAPGGPIQQMISKLKGTDVSATERVSGAGGELKGGSSGGESQYRGARGLDPAFIQELEKQYGFDKPPAPSFLFAVLLIVLFAGGSYLSIFPLRGLISDDWWSFNLAHKILDYLWHIALPITALVIGGFATLTMLTKNCFLDEINKQYVLTARSKGLTEHRVLYGHIFRNAMLLVVAGFPAAFIGILFTGALLIEVIFSLDGLGLLGFE